MITILKANTAFDGRARLPLLRRCTSCTWAHSLAGFLILCFTIFGAPVYGYDAVADFSTNSNPNGAWSYGNLSAFTGGTLELFSTPAALTGFTGNGVGWYNGGGTPLGVVIKNTSSFTINGPSSSPSVFIPTNLVDVDGQGNIASVRWTAPGGGYYNIQGLFQRTDNNPAAVNIEILENATAQLFLSNNFTGYSNTAAFSFSNVFLAAGAVLDFAQSCPVSGNHDGTGLAATIVNVQPWITSVATSGGNLLIAGTDGVPDVTYEELTTTNLTLPFTAWLPVATNVFQANGSFSLTNVINPSIPQQYFILKF